MTLLWAFTPNAAASAAFPEALRSKLGLSAVAGPPPGCQLCHRDDLGGLGTATKPLGRSLLKAGAMAGSVPSLLAALDRLDAEGTDSDGDGTPDVAELKSGDDPNVPKVTEGTPTPPVEQVPLPQTGCALLPAHSRDRSGGSSLVAALLVWSSRHYRRRRSVGARIA